MALTEDIVNKLREPFDPYLIKWKLQTSPKRGDDPTDPTGIAVAYVDARDVAERLDLATAGDWSNSFTSPVIGDITGQLMAECQLTVCGVTRRDVGTADLREEGSNAEAAIKGVHSDAFKRAAVLFGVAAHVYRFPKVRVKIRKSGTSWYITRAAEGELSELTRILTEGDLTRALPRFKHIVVVGSYYGAGGIILFSDENEDAPAPKTSAPTPERMSAPPTTKSSRSDRRPAAPAPDSAPVAATTEDREPAPAPASDVRSRVSGMRASMERARAAGQSSRAASDTRAANPEPPAPAEAPAPRTVRLATEKQLDAIANVLTVAEDLEHLRTLDEAFGLDLADLAGQDKDAIVASLRASKLTLPKASQLISQLRSE